MKKKTITNKLDRAWSIRIRDKGKCEYCGKTESLNAHHIFGRSARSVRWDLDNGVCLCAGCHTFSSKFSAHQTPLLFDEWIINSRGMEWYEKLKEKHQRIVKYTIQDLEEKLECLEE